MSHGLPPLDTIADVVSGHGHDLRNLTASTPQSTPSLTFYEFFAGGGMARAGLGDHWKCLFANDFDFKKSAAYKDNWGAGTLLTKDVSEVTIQDIPGRAALIWASFPCQDLSLAGMGAGLRGNRSGTFWPLWGLVKKLREHNRAPRVLVLENVCGTLTSHGGKDFVAIAEALGAEGYRYGALVIDAVDFVPQSRPRLFLVGVAEGVAIPEALTAGGASDDWHPKALHTAHARLMGKSKENWIWWNMPAPPRRLARFADLVEDNPDSVSWHTAAETSKLIAMMSDVNRKKLSAAQRMGRTLVGTMYKRTRTDDAGEKIQRAEVRFDEIAGCLRTASGGSSRQSLMVVKGDSIRSRLLSTREAARLMGLPDEYKLPKTYNEAYHLAGDGVVVPVVRHLAANILEPILLQKIMSQQIRSLPPIIPCDKKTALKEQIEAYAETLKTEAGKYPLTSSIDCGMIFI